MRCIIDDAHIEEQVSALLFSGGKEAAARLPSMKKDGSKSQAIVVCDNVVPG